MKKQKKTEKRFFKEPRLEIARILIKHFEEWESTTKVSPDEFYKLIDALASIKK